MNKDEVVKALRNEFYEKNKNSFYKENDLLQNACEWRCDCWEKIGGAQKEGAKWNYFSEPYIGEKYTGELVCVGLNVNKGGGRYLQEAQIEGYDAVKSKEPRQENTYYDKYLPGVRDSLRIGQKKVNFREGMRKYPDKDGKFYAGTVLWHRMPVYASIILGKCRQEGDVLYSQNNKRLMDDGEALAEVYDHIVYMDAIKCSPASDNSKPSNKMQENCIKKIFFRELEILRPKNILVLSHYAAELLGSTFHCSNTFPGTNQDFAHCVMNFGENTEGPAEVSLTANVYYVLHPTAPVKNPAPNCARSGSDLKLPKCFADFVQKYREVNI